MSAQAMQRSASAQSPEQATENAPQGQATDPMLAMQDSMGNEAVKSMISGRRGGGVGGFMRDAWNTTKKGVGLFGRALVNPASAGWKAAKEAGGNLWDTAKAGAGNTWDALSGGIGNTWDALSDGPGAAWDALKNGAGDAWTKGKDAVGNTWDALTGGISHIKDAVVGKFLEWEEDELYYKNGKKQTDPDRDRLYEAGPNSTTDNKYTRGMDVPSTTDKFTQNFSPLGIPLTKDAWEMQNRIDNGALQRLHDTTLMGTLSDAGVLDQLVKDGTLKATDIPADFSEMDPKALRDLVLTVDDASATRDFFKNMSTAEFTSFQSSILDGYMDLANQNPDQAVMLLDALPTEMEMGLKVSEMLSGEGPNNFQAGRDTSLFREGSATVADQMRGDGKQVYGLVVPYANSAENIVANDGQPKDLVEHFSNYLGALDPRTTSMISGYSQSAAGVLDYANQYGGTQGLDYAAAIAPMGGADRKGGTGQWAGTIRANGADPGVQTMSFMNENDPAQYIHTDEGKRHFYWSLANFVMPEDGWMGRFKKGDGQLHGGFDDAAKGTYGYPMAEAMPRMMEMIRSGALGEDEYQRLGGWDFDTRKR